MGFCLFCCGFFHSSFIVEISALELLHAFFIAFYFYDILHRILDAVFLIAKRALDHAVVAFQSQVLEIILCRSTYCRANVSLPSIA